MSPARQITNTDSERDLRMAPAKKNEPSTKAKAIMLILLIGSIAVLTIWCIGSVEDTAEGVKYDRSEFRDLFGRHMLNLEDDGKRQLTRWWNSISQQQRGQFSARWKKCRGISDDITRLREMGHGRESVDLLAHSGVFVMNNCDKMVDGWDSENNKLPGYVRSPSFPSHLFN